VIPALQQLIKAQIRGSLLSKRTCKFERIRAISDLAMRKLGERAATRRGSNAFRTTGNFSNRKVRRLAGLESNSFKFLSLTSFGLISPQIQLRQRIALLELTTGIPTRKPQKRYHPFSSKSVKKKLRFLWLSSELNHILSPCFVASIGTGMDIAIYLNDSRIAG